MVQVGLQQCQICLDDIAADETTAALSCCLAKFHAECLDKHCATQGSSIDMVKCPCCRLNGHQRAQMEQALLAGTPAAVALTIPVDGDTGGDTDAGTDTDADDDGLGLVVTRRVETEVLLPPDMQLTTKQ